MYSIYRYVLALCCSLPFQAVLAQTPGLGDLKDVVRDETGRTEYIVTLDKAAAAAHSKIAPDTDRLPVFNRPEVRNLIHRMERDYGFVATQMTSYVSNSFTALLDDDQIVKLQRDPRVTAIEANRYATFSTAVWSDTVISNDTYSWGRQAMIPSNTSSSLGSVVVYVIDSGVGYNGASMGSQELNVIQRVNAVRPADSAAAIGCYPHSSHVAGIIGARRDVTLTVGVFPGVNMVSVSVLDPGTSDQNVMAYQTANGTIHCNNGPSSASTYLSALNWVWNDVATRNTVGIVNISSNGPFFGHTSSVGQAMTSVSTPNPGYKGALVVQSAGNDYTDACTEAYDNAPYNNVSASNVIVVGALDAFGWPVQENTPTGGTNLFVNVPYASNEKASNWGPCVTMWAPGQKIISEFATTSYVPATGQYDQDNASTYATTVTLSGTSMAAPHVSGLAAYLKEQNGYTSPAAIKQAVFNSLYGLGTSDLPSNTGVPRTPVKMPSVQPVKLPASPTDY